MSRSGAVLSTFPNVELIDCCKVTLIVSASIGKFPSVVMHFMRGNVTWLRGDCVFWKDANATAAVRERDYNKLWPELHKVSLNKNSAVGR